MKPTIAILSALILCGCGKKPDQKSWTLRIVNTNEPVTITFPLPEEVENTDPDIVMDNRMFRMVPNKVVTNVSIWDGPSTDHVWVTNVMMPLRPLDSVNRIAFWDKDTGEFTSIGHAEWEVQTNWNYAYTTRTLMGWTSGDDPNVSTIHENGTVSSNLVCVIEWKEKRFTNILESIPITNVVRTFQEKVIRIYE